MLLSIIVSTTNKDLQMSKTREESNQYAKLYQRKKREERRKRINEILGNKCAICGSTEQLVCDHIDPQTKSFNICDKITANWDILLEELKKCQLLCFNCHVEKTAVENTQGKHGTISMYMPGKRQRAKGKQGCRCPECVEAWSEYQKNYSKTKRLKTKSDS